MPLVVLPKLLKEVETPYVPWFGYCKGTEEDSHMPPTVEALAPNEKEKGNYVLYMPAVLLLMEMCPQLSLETSRELLGKKSVWLSRGGGPAGTGTGRWILISALADVIRENLQWFQLKQTASRQ